jgi:hypothetical protein
VYLSEGHLLAGSNGTLMRVTKQRQEHDKEVVASMGGLVATTIGGTHLVEFHLHGCSLGSSHNIRIALFVFEFGFVWTIVTLQRFATLFANHVLIGGRQVAWLVKERRRNHIGKLCDYMRTTSLTHFATAASVSILSYPIALVAAGASFVRGSLCCYTAFHALFHCQKTDIHEPS